MSEEGETTIHRCRYSKDVHRNKCQARTIARLALSLYSTKIARIRRYTMLSTILSTSKSVGESRGLYTYVHKVCTHMYTRTYELETRSRGRCADGEEMMMITLPMFSLSLLRTEGCLFVSRSVLASRCWYCKKQSVRSTSIMGRIYSARTVKEAQINILRVPWVSLEERTGEQPLTSGSEGVSPVRDHLIKYREWVSSSPRRRS